VTIRQEAAARPAPVGAATRPWALITALCVLITTFFAILATFFALLPALTPFPASRSATADNWTAFDLAVASVRGGTPFDPTPFAGRCGDPAGSWLNARWSGEVRWQFNLASVPGYLADAVPPDAVPPDASMPDAVPPDASTPLAAARSAADAVAHGDNSCDLPADLTIHQSYTGNTDRRASVTSDAGCGRPDGHNVISFGTLPMGLLAVTCVWWERHPGGNRSVEADMLVDAGGGTFFLAPPADCRTRWDLEGILTHEFGHVFGLGHVPYSEHSALTMSDSMPECTTAYRGLGLGDWLTLRAHYGPQGS
jgi:hypothetical protein